MDLATVLGGRNPPKNSLALIIYKNLTNVKKINLGLIIIFYL